MRSRRVAVFAAIVAGAVALSVGYVGWAVVRSHGAASRAGIHVSTGASIAATTAPAAAPASPAPAAAPAATPVAATGAAPAAPAVRHAGAASLALARVPQIVFRSMLTDGTFGKVAVAPLAGPRTQWRVSSLKCDRVYFAGGRGICLAAGSAVAPVAAVRVFAADFSVIRTLRVSGLPSRARVSPDGRYGSVTTFVYGHSYAAGAFSTQTTLIDMATGSRVATLEQFAVTRGGRPFKRRDFNFWGVTFARDSNTFYATLGTGGTTYLVRGDLRARTATVLRTNVECPSLSPDGTRLAFKKKDGGSGIWHLAVLDLRTMKEHPVAEPQVVDDQAEWLGTDRLLYWRGNTIWAVPADGTGTPTAFVPQAASPTVVG